nr:RNA-directed DNA polymerase, eukaryota [Tanacetum cinerariifolium]
MVSIKVNILAWKVKLDVLPTRFNLSKKCLDINFILCRICENHAESSSHLFFARSMARDIFRNIASWWDIKSLHVSSFDELEMWTSSLALSSRRKQILEAQKPRLTATYNTLIDLYGKARRLNDVADVFAEMLKSRIAMDTRIAEMLGWVMCFLRC